jgi:peroxiredoxin Q/BCP
VALSVAAANLRAQDSTTAVSVGQQAPDFTASGATRYGVLRDSVKLSDLRGQTVVLAFFYKARTKG